MKPNIFHIFILFTALAVGLPGDTPEELIVQGDAFYAQRHDPAQAAQSLARYQEALRLSPDHFAALGKAAKIMYFIGDTAGSSDEKLKIFKQAMDIAKKMIVLHPGRAEGYYWLGVHTGMYGETRGVLKSLFLKNDIIAAMNKSIAIDGSYEQGGAYCVLGRLYYKVPGLFGGSKKRSRQNLEKCRELAPGNSTNLLFLAETYWALDEEELAIRTLEELIAMAPDPAMLPETEKDKAAGRKLLAKYKK